MAGFGVTHENVVHNGSVHRHGTVQGAQHFTAAFEAGQQNGGNRHEHAGVEVHRVDEIAADGFVDSFFHGFVLSCFVLFV